MIKLFNGFFVVKLLQAKVAFIYAQDNLNDAIVKSDCKIILSESSFGGGLKSDHLVASSPGEYGLDNLSVKVKACKGYNINSLKLYGGISLTELPSSLISSDSSREDLLSMGYDASDSSEDGASITMINSLGDSDFDEDSLIKGMLSLIKNTESQRFILLAPSGSANSLVDKFTKSGIEASTQVAEELKFKKASDMLALKEVTIAF